MTKFRKNQEYALYKGEECLAIGTIEEIAKQQGIKEKSVYFMLMPTYKKRVKNSRIGRKELVKL